MKHKHADLIHQWADGAEIQCKNRNDGSWFDTDPDWDDFREYRIKPEEKKPEVRWLWAYCWESKWEFTNLLSDAEISADKSLKNAIKLEWSRTEFPE